MIEQKPITPEEAHGTAKYASDFIKQTRKQLYVNKFVRKALAEECTRLKKERTAAEFNNEPKKVSECSRKLYCLRQTGAAMMASRKKMISDITDASEILTKFQALMREM